MKVNRSFFFCCLIALVLLGGCEREETKGLAFLSWSPDGLLLASIYQGVILVGDTEGARAMKKFEALGLAENSLAWSPDSACLAYTSDAKGSWDIYILNIESGESVAAIDHPAKEQMPCWLPPGRYMVFLSYRSMQPDLWLYDLETSDVYEITHDELAEEQVTCSVDGARIAFISRDEDGAADINVVEVLSGRRATVLIRERGVTSACISPDGGKVCYATTEGIFTVNVRFGRRAGPGRLLVKGDTAPITHVLWSPDGKNILFERDGRGWIRSLWLLGSTRLLAPTPGGDSLHCWSPDGRSVAYAAAVEGESPAVAVVNVKRRYRHWLVRDTEAAVAAAEYLERAGCWSEIADLLERVLAEFEPDKHSAEAINELCEAYFRVGNYNGLLRIHKEITKDRTALGLIYLFCYGDAKTARVLLEDGAKEGEEDARQYLNFLDTEPGSVVRLYCSAELARRRAQYSRAVSKIERFIRKAPDTEFAGEMAYALGDIYRWELREPERAADAYEEAVRTYPETDKRDEALLSLAETLQEIGHTKEALVRYEEAAEAANVEVKRKALYAIADVAKETGDTMRAIAAVDALLESVPAVDPKDPAAATLVEKRNKERMDLLSQLVELNIEEGRAERAIASAERLTRVFATDAEERREALPQLMLVFDKADLHEEADELLQWGATAGGIQIRLIESPDGWLEMLRMAPKKVLFNCRLGELPSWMIVRIERLCRLVRMQKGRMEEVAFLEFIASPTPEALESVLLGVKGDKRLEPGMGPLLQAIGNYILGNYYQSEDNMARAIDYYIHMHKAVEDEETVKVLERCQGLLSKHEAVVKRWFEIERETGHGIWKGVGNALGEAMSEEEALKRYEDFIVRYPETDLTGDAYFRAAQCSIGAKKERYLKEVVLDYPNCDDFAEAFEDLMGYYYLRANYWVAAELVSSLMNRDGHRQHCASYLLELSKIYGEFLKDVSTARRYIRIIFEGYRGTAEWAFAKRLEASYLMDEGKWQEAINEIEDLEHERPGDEWVQRGRSLHTKAQCHEHMGDWDKAQEEYVNFITYYRESPDVKTAKVLARIMPKLSDRLKRMLYAGFPMDFVKAAPQLSEEERQKLYVLFPELAERVAIEVDRQVQGGAQN